MIMYAKKISYLEGNTFYVFNDEDERIATVNEGVILWEEGEEPYQGATEEVMAAVKEADKTN